ncbi:MAG: hypothetical protein ACRDTS_06090 [Mycobacterium sp.]
MGYGINDEWGKGAAPPPGYIPPQYDPDHPPMTIVGVQRKPKLPPRDNETLVGNAYKVLHAVRDAQAARNRELESESARYAPGDRASYIRAKQEEFANSEVAKLVDTVEQAVADREAQAQQRFNDLMGGMVDTSADAAAEERNRRYLAQARERIEKAGSSPKQIAAAQTELARADRNRRGLLADELSAVFAGSEAGTRWVQETLTKVDPELAAAKQELHRASQAREIISHRANSQRAGFQRGMPPPREALDALSTAIDRYDPDR